MNVKGKFSGKSLSRLFVITALLTAAFCTQAVFAEERGQGTVYNSPNGDGYTPYNLKWEADGYVSFNVIEPSFAHLGGEMQTMSYIYNVFVWRDGEDIGGTYIYSDVGSLQARVDISSYIAEPGEYMFTVYLSDLYDWHMYGQVSRSEPYIHRPADIAAEAEAAEAAANYQATTADFLAFLAEPIKMSQTFTVNAPITVTSASKYNFVRRSNTLIVSSGGNIIIDGQGVELNAGEISGIGQEYSSGKIVVKNGGKITLRGGARFSLLNGNVTIEPGGRIEVEKGEIELSSGVVFSSFENNGDIVVTDGSVTINNLFKNMSNGKILVNGGNLTVDCSIGPYNVTNDGHIYVESGASHFTIEGAAGRDSKFTNAGSITSRIQLNVHKATFINNGSLTLPTNRLNTDADSTFENNGTYDNVMTDNPVQAAAAAPASEAEGGTAVPTAATVMVNGTAVSFDAYNIGGSNYFKLRDLAYTLSGTEKQFEVSWDGENNAILLISGQAYTAQGGEMASGGGGNKNPLATSAKLLLNGSEIEFTIYNIDGSNYFKLRDIGETFDFNVGWDGSAITIDTSKNY